MEPKPNEVGYRIRHNSVSNAMILVPLEWRPMEKDSIKLCNLCGVVHVVQNLHLHVEPDGTFIVSRPGYESLMRAGMPDMEFVDTVANPPPLRLDGPDMAGPRPEHPDVVAARQWREGQNQQNRGMRLFDKWLSRMNGKRTLQQRSQ